MSEENLIKYYAFVFFLVFKCFAISTDQSKQENYKDDLMNGNGLFLSQSIAAYSLNGHTYTFLTSNNSNVLRWTYSNLGYKNQVEIKFLFKKASVKALLQPK